MRAVRTLPVLWAIVATYLAAQTQSNVFLITIDTLRADHVHCYGYGRIRTPALDALAKEGILFAEAFTPSPITNTSHTSILTGLLPSTHGVTDFGVLLAGKNQTLAELLKKQGYETAAFIGSVVLDSKEFAPGLDRGFDFYDNFPRPARTKSRWGRLERRGEDVVQHANAWLNAHRASPRFVWIHLYDPHDPYEPPPPYSEIYKERLYDGEIAYADSVLAGFVSFLKKHAWYDDSIIVVVGDHGEGLGEHHEKTHGIFLYDSTTHVPLIIKLPAERNSGRVVKSQVRTLDILPTVLDLLHVSPPTRLDGSPNPLEPHPRSDSRPKTIRRVGQNVFRSAYQMDLSESAIVCHFFGLQVFGCEEELFGIKKQDARLAGVVNHLLRFFNRHCERFFAYNMLSRAGTVCCHLCM
jgi:arylsulfatase A-like enzyme